MMAPHDHSSQRKFVPHRSRRAWPFRASIGGRFVAETLMPLILELERAYADAKADPRLQARRWTAISSNLCRPAVAALFRRAADRASQKHEDGGHSGGAKIYFKREELNHTGAHKVNNVLGQIMLARRMGKTRIIAETGAGHARCRDRDDCAQVRPRLRRLHGRRSTSSGRSPTCCACEDAGRRGASPSSRARRR